MTEEPGPESQSRSRRPSWSDLGPRVISALVLLPVAAFALYIGGWLFSAVIGAVFAGIYREWETMVSRRPLGIPAYAMIALVALAGLFYPLLGVWGVVGFIAAACIVALFLGREGLPWRIGGLIFFGLDIVAILALRGTAIEGALAGVYVATCVWMTDSAAFFTGRQIGGEKLAPDISPSKTWSGALGGLALGTVSGIVVWAVVTDSPLWIGGVLAVCLSVIGQVGDLIESAIKRTFRIKDSGDIIPGHGGLMDRLDSLALAILFALVIGVMHGGFDNVAGGLLTW